jgi:hypothetical protein
MTPPHVNIGQTVYLKGTNIKGVVLSREKYYYGLRVKFKVKWEDNTETEEHAHNLKVKPNAKTAVLKPCQHN